VFRNPKLHLKALIGALLFGSGISFINLGDDLLLGEPLDGIKLTFNYLLPWAGIWLLEVWQRMASTTERVTLAEGEVVDAKLLHTTSKLAEEVAMNATKVNQLAQSRLQYTQQVYADAKSLGLDCDVMVALSRVSRDRVVGLERGFSQLDRLLLQRNNEQLQCLSLIEELRRLLKLYQQRFETKSQDAEQLSLFAERVNQLSLTLAIEAARSGKQGDNLVVTAEESHDLALDVGNLAESQQQQLGELASVGRQLDERLHLLDQLGQNGQQWQSYNAPGIRRQFAELQDNIEQLGQRAAKQAQLTEQVMKRLNVLSRDAEGALQGAMRNCSLGEQIRSQLKQALDETQ